MESGKSAGGKHGARQGKGEREDGVLPLDHLQGDAEAVRDGHSQILNYGRRGQ